ncbi:MAG: hypothetical protein J0I34_31720 [Pseudonocardia sp.]|uniref:hypothetical protein n=1 Tax=unclassified Pseudonocardia TaxID=2619320 RepID=UPI00086AE621|nr:MULTISPECIES: hypothetical protein [unclassified Pseudonocardia]MBN9113339.1 hypothetical protein [Pseudonocardia sp.]ODU23702.1 MAG: hypothetical protein ABS80_14120 [Pseudonocardia sp. SCN 72-51]ODV02003.1 MAG: hypothetical protein ABT15_26525 [Pseudonocardia sp. SCN 73-27]
MLGINHHRYEGFSLAQKLKWLGEGSGSSAIAILHQGMTNIGGKFADSDQELRRQLEPLGIAWQGRAASEAGAAVTASAVRAEAHSDAGRAAGASVDGYGMSFGEMSRHVGASGRDLVVMDVERAMSLPAGAPFVLLGPVGGPFALMAAEADHREAVEQVRTIDAKANAALYVHEDTSRQALGRFPVAETAPAADTQTGAAAGGGLGGALGAGLGGAGSVGGVGTPPVDSLGGLSTPRPPGTPPPPDHTVRPPDPAVPPPGLPGGPRVDGSSVPKIPSGPPIRRVPDPPPGTVRPDPPGLTTPGLPRGTGTPTGRGFADKLFRAGGGQGVAEPTTRAPAGARDAARAMTASGRPGGSGLPGGMYPPMAGAAGSRSGNDRHTPRYVVPSSAAFDVDTPYVAPVIGGEEQR